MAEDNLNDSQSIFSSVLGLVSREIQDFVVTAVTGGSTTLSHQVSQLSNFSFPRRKQSHSQTFQPSQNHGATKHKRSRSMNSSRRALPTEQAKRKRRPSSPHPKNLADDESAEYPADDDQENGIQGSSEQKSRYSLDNEGESRPGTSYH